MKSEIKTTSNKQMKNKTTTSEKVKHLTREEEEKYIKYWNKRIKYDKLKRGINKNKDDYLNQRYKKYVREENKIRKICRNRPDLLAYLPDETKNSNETPQTNDAPGKKKPNKHTYPTTNKEMWENLINERYGIENPEIINLRKQRQQPTPTKLPSKYLGETKEQPIMLYDGESVAFYQAKIRPRIKTAQTIDVWRKEHTRQRIKVRVEEWNYNEENMNRKISTPIGEITINSLLKTMLATDAKIYKILYIHHRQPQQPQPQEEGAEM